MCIMSWKGGTDGVTRRQVEKEKSARRAGLRASHHSPLDTLGVVTLSQGSLPNISRRTHHLLCTRMQIGSTDIQSRLRPRYNSARAATRASTFS